MDNAAAEHLARKIVLAALGCRADQIGAGLQAYDIPEWDSFGHMTILGELEEELDTKIIDEDVVEKLTKFDNIVSFISDELMKSERGSAHE